MRFYKSAACLTKAAVLVSSFMISPTFASDVSDFYRDKTMSFVVGFDTASGYNTYGRLLAKHMGKHIPGNPTIIVRNMPGAAGLTASNWMYNVAPKDGTTLGIMLASNAIDGLFGDSKVLFDATKVSWLGNMDVSVGTCIVMTASGIGKFEDLLKTETLFGSTGPTGGNTQHAMALKNLFNAKIKLISGYDGGGAIKLAMERGEVSGTCGLPSTNLKFQWGEEYKAGKVKALIHDFNGKVADLPGVPSAYDYVTSEQDRQVLDLVFGWHELGRPIIAPPDLPADRLRALKDAFLATVKDPEFLADAEKQNLTISTSSGDAVAEKIRKFFNYPKPIIERASNAVRMN